MSGFNTLEELLRDKEEFDNLVSLLGERLLSLSDNDIDRAPSAPVSDDESVIVTIEDQLQILTQCDTVPTAPSPTYSFPSLSDDESVIAIDEDVEDPPISTLPEEENTTPPEETKTSIDPKSLRSIQRPGASRSSSTDSEHHINKQEMAKIITLPPLFVKAKEKKWIEITCWCFERKIKFHNITRTPYGIKTVFSTFEDFNEYMKLLKEKNIPFCTSVAKPLRAVIHRIPSDLTCDSIKQDLVNQNVAVRKVYRLGRGSNGVDVYDIVVAIVDWSAKGKLIFKINSLCNLPNISVEGWNKKNRKRCVRCRLYGHFDSFCRVPLCCQNCDGDHVTPDCEFPDSVNVPYSEYDLPGNGTKCRYGVRCCYKSVVDLYASHESVNRGLHRSSLSTDQKASSNVSNRTEENSAEQYNSTVNQLKPTAVQSLPTAEIKQSLVVAKLTQEIRSCYHNLFKPKLTTESSNQMKSTAGSSKCINKQLVPTGETSKDTDKQLKPVAEQSKPITESKAVQIPSPEPDDQGLKADVALVTRFANEFFSDKNDNNILEINKLIRENVGNPLALVHIGMQHASILEKLSNFRIDS